MKEASIQKKRRLDNNVPPPPSKEGEKEGELPPELWAEVLGYLHFDEALTCTAVSKVFLHDVTRHMKCLSVRSGEGMDIAPSAIERFSSVEKVFIRIIDDIIDRVPHGPKYHLDCAALEHAASFLSGLPKLKWCFIGGPNYKDYVTYDASSDAVEAGIYDQPDANEIYAQFIQSICKAYRLGGLSEDVEIEGLIPIFSDCDCFPPGRCQWRNLPPISCSRSDVPCQLCDLISMSLPPVQLLTGPPQLVCIEFKNRVRIARFRDEQKLKQNLTEAMLTSMAVHGGYKKVMCPPSFTTPGVSPMYDDWIYNMIEAYTSNGADVDGLKLLRKLKSYAGGERGVLTLNVYNKLRCAGLNLNQNDFTIVDESDERTKYLDPEEMIVREQVKSGTPLRDVELIRGTMQGVRDFFAEHYHVSSFDLTTYDMQGRLESWLGIDMSDRADEIQALWAEYF